MILLADHLTLGVIDIDINMTFYTDPVFNVELFFAKQRLFWLLKVILLAKQFSFGALIKQHLQCC